MMDCLVPISPMGRFSVHTASLYFYIRSPYFPCRRQVESLVSLAIHLPCPLLPAVEAALCPSPSLLHLTLCNSCYSLRAHCIGGDIRLYFVLPWLALVTQGAHAFG
jgi:hypothetical protein